MGVLAVLDHPHAPAFIEIHEHRLGDRRLGGKQLDHQARGRVHGGHRLRRGQRPAGGRGGVRRRFGSRERRRPAEGPEHGIGEQPAEGRLGEIARGPERGVEYPARPGLVDPGDMLERVLPLRGAVEQRGGAGGEGGVAVELAVREGGGVDAQQDGVAGGPVRRREPGREVVVMPAVAPAQDVLVEGRPGGMRLIPGLGGEGVAGGADADQRLAGGEVGAHQRRGLRGARGVAADADHQQVSGGQGLEADEVVGILGVLGGIGAAQTAGDQFPGRELRQGGGGVVFRFPDEEQHQRLVGGAQHGTSRAGDGHDEAQRERQRARGGSRLCCGGGHARPLRCARGGPGRRWAGGLGWPRHARRPQRRVLAPWAMRGGLVGGGSGGAAPAGGGAAGRRLARAMPRRCCRQHGRRACCGGRRCCTSTSMPMPAR